MPTSSQTVKKIAEKTKKCKQKKPPNHASLHFQVSLLRLYESVLIFVFLYKSERPEFNF